MFRKALERVLELPAVYDLNQLIGRPTVQRYTRLVREELALTPETSVLELGCGTGATRKMMPARYCGIDINPDYVAAAKRAHVDGEFVHMDATRLAFAPASFDEVISVATTHHLDDDQLGAMTREALRVVRAQGAFHIVDAILPMDPRHRAKEAFFKMDRGRFARRLEQLVGVVSRTATVERKRVLTGPLHDVAYLKVVPIAPRA
jgi:ubiquinone/menaquinone biosynthesis C-methylase UbiE